MNTHLFEDNTNIKFLEDNQKFYHVHGFMREKSGAHAYQLVGSRTKHMRKSGKN